MIKLLAFVLSLLGLLVSAYLLYEHISGGNLVCGISACNEVNNSKYAFIFGVPVSLLGVVYYFICLGLISFHKSRLFFFISIVGLAFSIYLTIIELFVIHAWCQWCILSAWIVCSLFIIGLRLVKKDTI